MNNSGLMTQQINPVIMQQQPNPVLIQSSNSVQSMNSNQLNEPAKDLRNLLNVPNQPTVIGISQQPKMQMQQQGTQNWMNTTQQQQQQPQQGHIQQQQPNQQIYMSNNPPNLQQQQQQQQQQQKPNQNFQFYDNNFSQ